MTERVKVHYYDGSLKSLKSLVNNLKLEPRDYHFNVNTKIITIHPLGLMLKPSDCYHVKIEEKE